MNEHKGWLIVWLGAALFFLACLGVSVAAFLWGTAFMEGIMH